MELRIQQMLKNDPAIIKHYFTTGEMPSMSAQEKKDFLNIIELFRTIHAAGMLDKVLGTPNAIEQLSLF